MSFLETAGAFILNVLSKNEEAQKFEKDFVNASVTWVRNWFLKDDPTAKYVLDADNEVPKEFVQTKLEKLIQNPDFKKELQDWINKSESAIIKEKNIVKNTQIKGKNVHIGDKTTNNDSQWDRKNIIEGGSIDADGDFHLGDG
ncbi:MAG TPA: hypothetical protein ENK91_03545 [Bacteroidetes bacterium]|nr:hypothetical protein [Bacteroidota bacterium]